MTRGFTLLELLIVIGILAILTTVVLLVLNPIEYLKQARDANRLTDLNNINTAIGMYQTDGGNSYGSSLTVYVSIPDNGSPTCADLGLPTLPAGWSYACSNSTNYRKTDGTGWIPINFQLISFKSPFSVLPIDPINTTTSLNYYTYIGGSWALSAALESQKYLKQISLANVISSPATNSDPSHYIVGSNPSLWTQSQGLVGWWPLNEGSGNAVNDMSGNGNNGLASGGNLTWASSGCALGMSSCITATSTAGTATIPSVPSINLSTNFTISNWVKINTAISNNSWPISFGLNDSHKGYNFRSWSNGTSWMFEYATDNPTCGGAPALTNTGQIPLGIGTWHMLTATYDGTNIKIYLDGIQIQYGNLSNGMCANLPFNIASTPIVPGSFSVNDARIYNRVLSAAEIQAIYNAEK